MKTILETDRLFLREFLDNDYNDLCEILQDKEVMYAYEHSFSEDEVKGWFNWIIEHYAKHGFGLWAVIHKETNEFLGQCGLTIQNLNGNKYLEIGYLFKKKHWHKGYAVEAASCCKKYAFENLNAEKVYSIVRDDNIASQNVAKRIGMKKIDEVIKHYCNIDILHYIFEVKRGNILINGVNMKIEYGSKISIDEFNFLRKMVGWNEIEKNLAKKSIENALFIITAIIDGKVIGLTRVSGDGGYTVLISDVIVLPEYQGKGIGKTLMTEAMKYIKNQFLEKGQTVFVNLMSAKGKESFYKRFGFEERPNDKVGAGMTQWIKYE